MDIEKICKGQYLLGTTSSICTRSVCIGRVLAEVIQLNKNLGRYTFSTHSQVKHPTCHFQEYVGTFG